MSKIFTIAVSAIAVFLVFSQTSFAGTDKTEVEKIIEEYILNNPEIILQSVNDYQTNGVSERQQRALEGNKRQLFENSFTPYAGNKDGDIVVVEFFDYNCGYCKRAYENVNKLINADKNVKFIFKEFPILGPTSETAARWALAAHNQDKYVEFHNALMQSKGRISDKLLEDVATSLNLDLDKMKKDSQSDTITEYIASNRALASELRITGTPGFIIQDEVIPGAISYEEMVTVIADKRAATAKN